MFSSTHENAKNPKQTKVQYQYVTLKTKCQPYFIVAATTLKSKLKDPIDTDYFKSETLL